MSRGTVRRKRLCLTSGKIYKNTVLVWESPPAKPIKVILEEQARRKTRTQEGARQQSDAREQSCASPDEETKAKELRENKERYAYTEALEVLEGDGSLPRGWSEAHSDGNISPSFRSSSQRRIIPPCDKALFQFTNLCLQNNYQGFRIDRKTEEMLNSFPRVVVGTTGCDPAARVDPHPQWVLSRTENLEDLPVGRGVRRRFRIFS